MARTPFGFNLSGVGFLLNQLDELNDKWAGKEVKWVVGTNVKYAVYLEFGTKHHPAYPFLFPAARDVVNSKGDAIARSSDNLEELIAKIAIEIERQAKINATAGRAGGRSPGTHPEHPKVQSSQLRDSIRAEKVS